ncbi:hypothetical protein [Pinibacter aurantiacus]|uniref:Lipoprotein n=1 Tax=Pinibacter aurantiacus TaxID=2851599 RepID=A0A9E2SCY3_9BACT|nr:hypothetical protein [Pinibacter aurantiacus]MBV4359077.1 hypothetical protein [Pinibacter aurantiacus]
MKLILLLTIALTTFFGSCTNSPSDKIREFIPGMYVRQLHDEFTSGADTLIISEYDPSGGVYFIDSKMRYQQHLDGKIFPSEYKVKKRTGVYDPKTHQLIIQNTEDILTFLPGQNKLLQGRTEYNKVKD